MLSTSIFVRKIVKSLNTRFWVKLSLLTSSLFLIMMSFQNCARPKFTEIIQSSQVDEVIEPPVVEASVPTPTTPVAPVTPPPPVEPPLTPTKTAIPCSGSFNLVVWSDINKNGLLAGNTPIAQVNALSVIDQNRPNLSEPGFNIYAAKFKSSSTATTYSQAIGTQGNGVSEVSCQVFREGVKLVTILFSGDSGKDIISGLLTNDANYIWCQFSSISQNSIFNIYSEKSQKVASTTSGSIIITNNCGKNSQP